MIKRFISLYLILFVHTLCALDINEFVYKYYDSDEYQKYDYTMLSYAIANGNREIAFQLLQGGVDPNLMGYKKYTSPLTEAIYSEDYELVKALLLHKADPNIRPANLIVYNKDNGKKVYGSHEFTPIHQSIKTNKKIDILELLIQNGADVNLRLKHLDTYNGATPISYAVKNTRIDQIDLLLEHGADPFCICYNSNLLYDAVSSWNPDANMDDRIKVISKLIGLGLDINYYEKTNTPPAIVQAATSDYQILKTYLESGAHFNNYYVVENEIRKFKYKYEIDTHSMIFNYYKNYHLTKIKDNLDLLIEFGLDINTQHWFALPHLYGKESRREYAKLTPLMFLIANKNYDLASYLITIGANLETVFKEPETISGHTPLLLAIALKDEQGALFLIENGADPESPGLLDKNYHIPIKIAERVGMRRVVEALKEAIIKKYSK